MSVKILVDCFRKKAYDTRQEARQRAGRSGSFVAYRCQTCQKFHVAHGKGYRR